jgi:hypothetical protein
VKPSLRVCSWNFVVAFFPQLKANHEITLSNTKEGATPSRFAGGSANEKWISFDHTPPLYLNFVTAS